MQARTIRIWNFTDRHTRAHTRAHTRTHTHAHTHTLTLTHTNIESGWHVFNVVHLYIKTRTRWRVREVEERMRRRESEIKREREREREREKAKREREREREKTWPSERDWANGSENFLAYFEGTYVSSSIVNNKVVLRVVDNSSFFSFIPRHAKLPRSLFTTLLFKVRAKVHICVILSSGRRSCIFDFYRYRFDQCNRSDLF